MEAHPPHEQNRDVAVICAVRTFSFKNEVKKINTASVMIIAHDKCAWQSQLYWVWFFF
jgi:hypothetical protein